MIITAVCPIAPEILLDPKYDIFVFKDVFVTLAFGYQLLLTINYDFYLNKLQIVCIINS